MREVKSFGRSGNQLHTFVLRLGTVFQLAHQRPTLSESEQSHFTILRGVADLTAGDNEFFKEAIKWSVLYEHRGTKKKSEQEPETIEYVLNPIKVVSRKLGPALSGNLRTETADFLDWSLPPSRRKKFDCIVMNPPFLGRKKDETQVMVHWNGRDKMRSVSVEAAFTIRCLDLLADQGVLLSVLPASVVSGKNSGWLRRLIMSYGRVMYVHESPAKAFRKLEARLYRFAFERDGVRRPTLLCNHNLRTPEKLWVKASVLDKLDRWDYGFHEARQKLEAAVESAPSLGWASVGEKVDMRRGSLASPHGKDLGVHTSDFRDGAWNLNRIKREGSMGGEKELQPGDLLIRRVGRHCSRSVGANLNDFAMSATDCVLILRSRSVTDRVSILLGLKTILGSTHGASLVEQGTSATYIAEDSLRDLQIPTKVKEVYPSLHRRYLDGLRNGDEKALSRVETTLRQKIAFS